MKIKMSRKEIIQMIICILLALIALMVIYGWLPPEKEREAPQIIAEGTKWQLVYTQSNPNSLYFFYKGKGTIGGNTIGGDIVEGNINVSGKLYCSYDDNDPKEVSINEEIEGTSHPLSSNKGERRWYLTETEIENVQLVDCTLEWSEYSGDVYSEKVTSK